MWKLAIPEDVLEKLRCSLCKEYLSHLPIYSYPDQEGVGCGRCPVLSDQNPIRNVSYEAVAKYLFFPCRYRSYGCLENILPVHMQEHEESCMYKQYFCPFIPLASCPWQGPSNELFVHYEEQHNILALTNSSFEIDLVNMYEDNYLLNYNEELFVIHVKCDAKENMFWCGVRYIGNKKKAAKYMFQIELKDHNGVEEIVLPKTSVECDSSMNLNKETAVHIDSDAIRNALNDPCSVICNITISTINANLSNGSDHIVPVNKIASDDVDEDMLRELECPVCNEYMVPPIHQCVAGHSICGNCKTKVLECPTCRDKIQDTRNFSLEKMTRLIKYHCKYRDFGCSFISTSDKIRNHESECKFGPYECPLKSYSSCRWLGKLSDIMVHAKAEHEENILEVEIITWPFQEDCEDEDDIDWFLIKAHGEVFKLLFKYEQHTFYWSMQLVGPAEDAAKYMFELDFVDNSNSKQRLFIRHNCSTLVNENDAFTADAVFVQIPHNLVCPLMNGSDLIYKCHVIKKSIN